MEMWTFGGREETGDMVKLETVNRQTVSVAEIRGYAAG